MNDKDLTLVGFSSRQTS